MENPVTVSDVLMVVLALTTGVLIPLFLWMLKRVSEIERQKLDFDMLETVIGGHCADKHHVITKRLGEAEMTVGLAARDVETFKANINTFAERARELADRISDTDNRLSRIEGASKTLCRMVKALIRKTGAEDAADDAEDTEG